MNDPIIKQIIEGTNQGNISGLSELKAVHQKKIKPDEDWESVSDDEETKHPT